MIDPYTPKQSLDRKTLTYSSYSNPKPSKKNNPVHLESNKLVSSLDNQIAELEASMDALLGAKQGLIRLLKKV